jgi:hypothetical protein
MSARTWVTSKSGSGSQNASEVKGSADGIRCLPDMSAMGIQDSVNSRCPNPLRRIVLWACLAGGLVESNRW